LVGLFFFAPPRVRPRLSVRPPSACSGPTLQPRCPIRAAAAPTLLNASSLAIRPSSSPCDAAARPSTLSPLPAPPSICFPPLLSPRRCRLPSFFPLPSTLRRGWSVFSREIPAPRRQSHNSRRPATVGLLLPAHVISLPLSLPHPDPPDTGSVPTRSCSLPFSPRVRAGGRCVCKQIPVVRARSSFLPGCQLLRSPHRRRRWTLSPRKLLTPYRALPRPRPISGVDPPSHGA
jgi:hypothetical protein